MGGKSDVSTVTSFKFLIADLHDSAFSIKNTPSKTYQVKNYNTPIAIEHGSSSLSHQAATPSNLLEARRTAAVELQRSRRLGTCGFRAAQEPREVYYQENFG